MTKEASVVLDANRLVLAGELDFSNVMAIYQKSQHYFRADQNLIIDFSALKASNSAGLALMIEWLKLARQRKLTIQFHQIPEKLLAIVQVAGVDSFI